MSQKDIAKPGISPFSQGTGKVPHKRETLVMIAVSLMSHDSNSSRV